MFGFLFSVIFVCVGLTFGRKAPDYIRPCPNFAPECVKARIQEAIPKLAKGIPEFGQMAYDPLESDKVSIDLPGGLVIHFSNGKVTGLRNCIVDNVKMDRTNVDINIHCNITIRGKYKANGRVLIVAINGDGDAKIKISDIHLNVKAKFQDIVRNGEVYIDVKNYAVKHSYTNKSKVNFSLTNLFKGNPEISEAVLSFLNSNWRQVVGEFGTPVIENIAALLYEVIKKFFYNIPRKEIFGN